MEIKTTNINPAGEAVNFVYNDIASKVDIKDKKISAVHALCFYGDKLVIVYSEKKGIWTPPGGGVEGDETAEEATIREIKEETNMKVLKHRFIGYQDITTPKGLVTQTRSFCIVEPYGEFVADPDEGEITEIKLIDPKDHQQYFDWGKIGDRIMERALELKAQSNLEPNYAN
jgi:ADP-ribose pyrophosphatase YjhB (NUDIX family)